MTGTTITPYLNFGGRCEEALEFYRKALGAEVEMVMRFDESPTPPPPGMLPPGFEKKVMHASFRVRGVPLMASDGLSDVEDGRPPARSRHARRGGRPPGVRGPRRRRKIEMPLGETFWSPCFGMLTDRFGVEWMVSVPQDPSNG